MAWIQAEKLEFFFIDQYRKFYKSDRCVDLPLSYINASVSQQKPYVPLQAGIFILQKAQILDFIRFYGKYSKISRKTRKSALDQSSS